MIELVAAWILVGYLAGLVTVARLSGRVEKSDLAWALVFCPLGPAMVVTACGTFMPRKTRKDQN